MVWQILNRSGKETKEKQGHTGIPYLDVPGTGFFRYNEMHTFVLSSVQYRINLIKTGKSLDKMENTRYYFRKEKYRVRSVIWEE